MGNMEQRLDGLADDFGKCAARRCRLLNAPCL
jgi:hypothetical protein